MTLKDMKQMKLHETFNTKPQQLGAPLCLRVPGGWIYLTHRTSTFVPEPKNE